jgi:L-fuconolactonase
VDDLTAVLGEASVDGAVAVQARQTVAETEWLLALARQTPAMLGVVGWLPLASPELPRMLDRFSPEPFLKGVRHVVQGERAGFLDEPAFNHGVARLRTSGLVYDVLIFERQLEETIRFVDRHPEQAFVLDHVAKPKIASGETEPWRRYISELARRPGVTCKVSGMVTEANPQNWNVAQLQPYFDAVLEAFGPGRLMMGSDWPVLTLGCGYAQWWRLAEQWIASLSQDEQADILGKTAIRVYGLQPGSREGE